MADGDGKPQALSGTSMSTAVVSFAAALVRSQWQTTSGAALRHRLLVSARYEPGLAECDRAAAQTKIESDPKECVDHGAMLDIEAAVIVSKDLIEYEECPDQSEKNCIRRTRVGSLFSMPQSIRRCVYPQTSTDYIGLTRNAAVKRTAKGSYLIAVEPGQAAGKQLLQWNTCPVSGANGADPIRFRVGGLQLDGTTVAPEKEITVEVDRLVRVVTRAMQ